MSLFDTILLNGICVLFPLLIYIVFLANINNIEKDNKRENVLYELLLVTSIYLIIKLTKDKFNSYSIILLNIPILFSYIKGKRIFGLFLSIIEIVYFSIILDYNVLFLIVEYLSFFLFYMLIKNKNNDVKDKIDFFILIKALYFSFYIYYTNINKSIFIIFNNIIISLVALYICSNAYYWILKKGEEIIDLNNTMKELEKEKTIRNALFKLTHEVKNPISVCKGYLDMIDLKNYDKSIKYIEIIKSEINRTLIIMDDFLDFTKIKVNKSIMDINYLLEDVTKSMNNLFIEKHVKTDFKIEDEEIYIYGDYNRLKQVFINIIKNSIEAKKSNSKLIISIKTKKIKDKFKIIIKDNGKGMCKEELNNIGKIFYTTKNNGTGLGVSLCKEIIEKHDGNIKYYSSIGIGTEVVIILPIEKL
ncbi:MAG: HAMP domain-containing sensor histidine kinase [bacterium]|nr:HAMP domain-containing sensor histidine kinase [bacterium]